MKNESDTKNQSKEEPSLLQSLKIREDFSLDDINNILDQMDQVLTTYKAEQQGIDPSKMVKTVRGGRVVWITIEEMNAILSKRRSVFAKKRAQNVSEEETLSGKTLQRLAVIDGLGLLIKKFEPDQYPEFIKTRRKLEVVQNLSHSLSHEIRILGKAIQRKTAEADAIQEMDSATSSMINALEQNNLSEIDANQLSCNQNMEDYLLQQKRLEPYQKKMKESQLLYLQSKQNGFETEYTIFNEVIPLLAVHVREIINKDQQGDVSQSLLDIIQELTCLLNNGMSRFVSLTSLDVSTSKESNTFFDQFDKEELIPLFDRSAEFMKQFNNAWDSLNSPVKTVTKKEDPATKKTQKSVSQKIIQ